MGHSIVIKIKYPPMLRHIKLFLSIIVLVSIASCHSTKNLEKTIEISPFKTVIVNYNVTGSLTKKLVLDINNSGPYAGLSVFVNDELLVDDLNLPREGNQTLTCVLTFPRSGEIKIRFQSLDEKLIINSYNFEDISSLKLPHYNDITKQAGLDKVSSLKYGGPSIADIDNDGDYDFIVNNHNAETSKLYWNNGDGTVTKHDKDLARWFKHDLHGTSLGDYDNDGDLDLVIAQGGGNGENPSIANFYHNDNNSLIRFTGDVKINKGGRGRGSKWIDMDLDGDLDLLLINEASLSYDKPQQLFYENIGDGTFKYKSVKDIEDVEESRALVTDFNGDKIDDLVFYSPLSLWKGNGDFTFTEATKFIPDNIQSMLQINAVTDIDIDNDGDFDLYLARGKLFEHGKNDAPSLDFNPITKELAIKSRGYKGNDSFDFTAEGDIKLDNYYYLAQGNQLGKEYPIFLGKNKKAQNIKSGEDLKISPTSAQGWPEDHSENGLYIGYVENSNWKASLVRDGNIFWQYRFSLNEVSTVVPKFTPQNRNVSDILLRNDGNTFTDVSKEWDIPHGGNAMGVTTGDFNNDSHQDLFVYRWGRVSGRISDLMLLNTGHKTFETTTMHGANDVGGPGNGDMGQAFDFDLDGQIDLLNGSEGGEWYLYSNQTKRVDNYVIVKVGYSPQSNIDPISAEVIVTIADNEYRKRVGSAGEVFSQSLMNFVHFGVGQAREIERIQIRWRNGEVIEFKNKIANTIYDSDKVDPESLSIEPLEIRKGTKAALSLVIKPKNANNNVLWSSSDEKIISVDENGIVAAKGSIDQTARITVTSLANNLTAYYDIKIIEWNPILVSTLSLKSEKEKLYVGQRIMLDVTVLPSNADDSNITYSSNDVNILTVDKAGLVTAISPGTSTIKAVTTIDSVSTEIIFNVEPFIDPHITILNKEKFKNQTLMVNDTFKVSVNYHAGSGQRVISADEGGVRFWLRHFKSKWIPVKDIVHINKDPLYTTTGNANMTFSLKGITPTNQLPNGHFYQLRATFTSSNGNMYSDDILPLQIIARE